MGLINLIKPDSPNFSSAQREYFNHIGQASIEMGTLVNNLLDINRIEQGLNPITLEKVNLQEVLEHQVQIFRERADRKGITIRLEEISPVVELITDRNSLMRILENLISNAIKFSPHNKQVLVRMIPSAKHIKLEIKDQGPGIRKEEMPLLFKKYQRLNAKPTGGETSTGLGLSIVRELVRCLSGNITVESKENHGTSFIVELPYK